MQSGSGRGDVSGGLFLGLRGDRDGDTDEDDQEDNDPLEGTLLAAVLPRSRGVVKA